MRDDAVAAAVAVAQENGLGGVEPVVIRDATNVLVHLAPAPVVARISLFFGAVRGPEHAQRELDVATFLAHVGAPVAPPSRDVEPGPHDRDGFRITFWALVQHDRDTWLDAAAAGRALKEVHDAFHSYEGRLPRFDFLEEIDGLLADDELVGPADLELLRAARREIAIPGDLSEQPLHGDVHLGNVLWTRNGPLWTDFENACRGPVEFDLCELVFFAEVMGVDLPLETLGAYGSHDADLLDALIPLHGLLLTVWTARLAHRVPYAREILEQRLRWWRRRYAREM